MSLSGFISENFIATHGNAKSVAAVVVLQYLEEVDVPITAWPGPDRNAFEHL